jgi:hypothetical protein
MSQFNLPGIGLRVESLTKWLSTPTLPLYCVLLSKVYNIGVEIKG